MRKNTPRKWIHAILDLLPVLIIPIFAIFTRNENAAFSQEITVQENKVVDFNQLIDNVEYYDITDDVTNTGNVITTFYPNNDYSCVLDHQYLFKCRYTNTIQNSNIIGIRVREPFVSDTYNTNIINIRGTATVVSYFSIQVMKSTDSFASMDTCDLEILQLFDLTQMFGSGNEPTIEQFNQWYPNDYYEYTLSRKELLKDVNTVTYNDTDIGSQFMYALYKPVDKYFNFNKLFNMQDVYDWLQLNLFEGNAPIPVHIVWNIIVYEFFIDLIFLLYSVFMFIIDFATNMIDSFTRRNK